MSFVGSPLYVFCMQRGGGIKVNINGGGGVKTCRNYVYILNGWSQT